MNQSQDKKTAKFLKQLIYSFEHPLEVPFVSYDKKKEKKWIKKMIKSAKRIHNYISLEKL
jgi:hypothetical protein